MSFGNFSRKARDTALPYRYRVSALHSCVQLYRPIGFEATLSFLRAEAGPFRTDEAALLRALDMLEASRAAWHAEQRSYSTARRQAKRRGQRNPRPTDANPYTPAHWYGARREAALHAVRFWHQRRLTALITDDDRPSRDLRDCVRACLEAHGHLTPTRRQLLLRCIDRLTARLRSEPGHDRADQARTRDLLRVARHLEVATSPP